MALELSILFIFGCAIGSFLNVVAFRYDPEKRLFDFKSLGGRSHCPHCNVTLRFFELIPVISFILLRGRCQSCHKGISFQYPIVEIASGLTVAFIPQAVWTAFNAQFFELTYHSLLPYLLLSSFFILAGLALILLSAIDFRLSIIPDGINIWIAIFGIGVIATKFFYGLFGEFQPNSFIGHYAAIMGFRGGIIQNYLAAAIIGFLFFFIITILTRGRGMGMGDVKLAGALGLLLGWPDAPVALLLSFILGSVSSILFLIRRTKTMKSAIPFGPFIALAVFVTIFFGERIFDFYFTLFPS